MAQSKPIESVWETPNGIVTTREIVEAFEYTHVQPVSVSADDRPFMLKLDDAEVNASGFYFLYKQGLAPVGLTPTRDGACHLHVVDRERMP